MRDPHIVLRVLRDAGYRSEHPRVVDLQARLGLLPEEPPDRTDGDPAQNDAPSEIVGDSAFVIYQ